MEILKEFGVQPILLLAQIVNFLLLLIILRWLFYTPMLKMLKTRRQKIENSIKNAHEIELRLARISSEREEALQKAALEAKKIIDQATRNATEIIAASHEKAAQDAIALVEKTRTSLSLEREQMYRDLRGKLADMIILGFERVAGKILTEKDQKDLISSSIKDIS